MTTLQTCIMCERWRPWREMVNWTKDVELEKRWTQALTANDDKKYILELRVMGARNQNQEIHLCEAHFDRDSSFKLTPSGWSLRPSAVPKNVRKLSDDFSMKKISSSMTKTTLTESKSRVVQTECDGESKEIEKLKRKVDDLTTSSKRESDDLKEQVKACNEEIDRYKGQLDEKRAEFDNYKLESESEKRTMENDAQKKMDVIENLRSTQVTVEAEWKSAMDKMKCEMKKKDEECENIMKVSDNLNEQLQASREEINLYMRDSDARISKMENTIKLKEEEIANFKKHEAESTNRIAQLESEANAYFTKIQALEIAHQKAQAEMESQIRKKADEANLRTDELAYFKSTHSRTEAKWKSAMDKIENEIKIKIEEIRSLKKHEAESTNRIAQLESEANAYFTKIQALEIAHQKAQAEMESQIRKKADEANLRTDELAYFKSTHSRTEAKWKSAMDKMENEIKIKIEEIQYLKIIQAEAESSRESEKTQMENAIKSQSEAMNSVRRKFAELEEQMVRCKTELNEKITRLEKEVNSKNEELEYLQFDHQNTVAEKEALIRKNEDEAQLRMTEIAGLRKSEGELKMRISQLEKEVEIEENPKTAQTTLAAAAAEPVPIIEDDVTQNYDEAVNKGDSEETPKAGMTFNIKFSGISSLTDRMMYSKPIEYAGKIWNVSVHKNVITNSISFYLYAEKNDAVDWFCPVLADIRLSSPTSSKVEYPERKRMLYHELDQCQRLTEISEQDLVDEENGWVTGDVLCVSVAIRAFPIRIHEARTMEILAKFTEISQLTSECAYSEPSKFAGITWKMSVCKGLNNHLVFSLHAENRNADTWWCPVVVDFLLISENAKEITRRIVNFEEKGNSAYLATISDKDLEDEDVEDDSIVVAITIRAFRSEST